MRFGCRLEGGPCDGHEGVWTGQEHLPEQIYAYICPSCDDIHWSLTRETLHAELYSYDRTEDEDRPVAIYVYADLDLSDGRRIFEEELVPAGAR